MLNESQIQILFEDYLSSNARKGALLISGQWGTGKTHLALTKLRPAAEARNFKTVYLSVADTDTQASFERALLHASIRLLSGKASKRVLSLAGSALDYFLSPWRVSVKEGLIKS